MTEIRHLNLPAGDLRQYEASLDSQSVDPNVPLEAAQARALGDASANAQVLECALVHIPLYTFKYTFKSETYTAIVEAGTGATLANLYPAKAEAPYLLAGILAAVVFLCLALMPVIGALINDSDGFAVGASLCLGLGILAAPILFAVAAWVAAKV